MAAAGYEAALCIEGGWIVEPRRPFAVPRMDVPAAVSHAGFQLARERGVVVTRLPAILVTDGEQRAGVGGRSLVGYRGLSGVCLLVSPALAWQARRAMCAAKPSSADPLEDPQRFAADVRALSRNWNIGVLIPIGGRVAARVAPRSRASAKRAAPVRRRAVVRRMADKAAVLDAAALSGSRSRGSKRRRRSATRSSAIAPALEYPVVLKPSRSVGSTAGGGEASGDARGVGRATCAAPRQRWIRRRIRCSSSSASSGRGSGFSARLEG